MPSLWITQTFQNSLVQRRITQTVLKVSVPVIIQQFLLLISQIYLQIRCTSLLNNFNDFNKFMAIFDLFDVTLQGWSYGIGGNFYVYFYLYSIVQGKFLTMFRGGCHANNMRMFLECNVLSNSWYDRNIIDNRRLSS